MAWRIEVSAEALKALKKLDKPVVKQILAELQEISALDNPRSRGKALQYNLARLWRYRVGDYRIVCHLEDEAMVVLVVDVAHRSKVYKDLG